MGKRSRKAAPTKCGVTPRSSKPIWDAAAPEGQVTLPPTTLPPRQEKPTNGTARNRQYPHLLWSYSRSEGCFTGSKSGRSRDPDRGKRRGQEYHTAFHQWTSASSQRHH